MISCIESCDFCNKRHHCIYPFTWNKNICLQSNHTCIYMTVYVYMELFWALNVEQLPKPWIKQTYISFAIIKKISHLHLKRRISIFWKWQRTFWKFIQCTAPYSWVHTRISQKGLFEWAVCLTNNNSRKNRWKKRMNFCLHPKSWWKLRDWHGLQLVNGGWDVKPIHPMLQQPKNK